MLTDSQYIAGWVLVLVWTAFNEDEVAQQREHCMKLTSCIAVQLAPHKMWFLQDSLQTRQAVTNQLGHSKPSSS